MLFATHIPQPPLNRFVDLFWFYDGYSPGPHSKERLMPDGSVELVINLKEDEARIYDREKLDKYVRLPGALLCGPHSSFFVIDTSQQASVIGVHFKPGGAFPFFKMPAGELHNLHVSLQDLWGPEAGLLRERLLEAQTPENKLRVLEECLLDQAFRPLERHRAVDCALGLFRNIHTAPAMADVSDQIGISSRRFIQLFSSEVGLTPKLFCRVRRFQQVLQMIHRGDDCDWADVAAGCGYFDQAHFIHDFKEFSGINPTTYLAQKTEHLNHVPIHE
ncbi:MAG TPA: helix-turn-helix domain-containing protein [Candidatus Angelobacter sp.]|jgi:AraC-like DNA-binding protein|nr:helix-turn-helix domain-containing protein [Candidatus Angelobacter sp.]